MVSERYEFYALSRFEDVLAAYTAPEVYSSSAGPQLEELLARFPTFAVDLDGVERKWAPNFRGWSKVPISLS